MWNPSDALSRYFQDVSTQKSITLRYDNQSLLFIRPRQAAQQTPLPQTKDVNSHTQTHTQTQTYTQTVKNLSHVLVSSNSVNKQPIKISTSPRKRKPAHKIGEAAKPDNKRQRKMSGVKTEIMPDNKTDSYTKSTQSTQATHATNSLRAIRELVARNHADLYVAQSRLPNAGFGLFAARDFQANEPMIAYTGIFTSKQNLQKLYTKNELVIAPYAIPYENGFVDAYDPATSSRARYANDALMMYHIHNNDKKSPFPQLNPELWFRKEESPANSKSQPNNAHIVTFDDLTEVKKNNDTNNTNTDNINTELDRSFLVSMLPIKKGDEIFVSYGIDYWGNSQTFMANRLLKWWILDHWSESFSLEVLHSKLIDDKIIPSLPLPTKMRTRAGQLRVLIQKLGCLFHTETVGRETVYALNRLDGCISHLQKVFRSNHDALSAVVNPSWLPVELVNSNVGSPTTANPTADAVQTTIEPTPQLAPQPSTYCNNTTH